MGRASSALFLNGPQSTPAAPRLFIAVRAPFRAIDVHAFDADVFRKHGVAAMGVIRMGSAFHDFAGEIELCVLTGVLISHDVRLAGFR